MFAKEWLLKILSSPNIQNPCPAQAILHAAKGVGIKKIELKKARKHTNIQSFKDSGIQYWYLSEENDA